MSIGAEEAVRPSHTYRKQKLKNITSQDTARILAGATSCIAAYFALQQAKRNWDECLENISVNGAFKGGWASVKDVFWTTLGHENPGNVFNLGQNFAKSSLLTVGWTSSTLLFGAVGIRLMAKGFHLTDEDEEINPSPGT